MDRSNGAAMQSKDILRFVALGLGLAWACAYSAATLGQSSPPSRVSSASPIQTQFKAFKVYFLANGQEELEPASSVIPGDVVEYVALHRNASQRRLQNVDFSIPIPWGTMLWEGSIKPADGKLLRSASPANDMKNKLERGKDLARVVWRVGRLEPGQSVELRLRVSIDPDPTLGSAKPPNPFAPRVPDLRKP